MLRSIQICSYLLCATAFAAAPAAVRLAVDYPINGSVFPPEFPAPTFLYRDSTPATSWKVEITFADGAAVVRDTARGEHFRPGEIDPRCVSNTNKLPQLTREQTAARTWQPSAGVWTTIKQHSVEGPAVIRFIGMAGGSVVSSGQVSVRTSRDPVGAPIFYRDVPLMPSETERGVIKPLASSMVPLIAWRVRDVSQTSSRVVMTGIHSCANCHSFSANGRTMGMDIDGPHNDKGLYALLPVKREMTITDKEVVAWSTFRGKLGGKLRVGFMSQVSPDGEYVVTTINDPGEEQSEYQRRKNPKDLIFNYYVANFKDYRFLQVFYPTRGILAWYNRAAGHLQPLPGADDPRYVHTNATWSPDGKYLVFARAVAKDAYSEGAKMAEFANDPNETQIRYDLYRIPFNDGKGGVAEPIAGASANGMSNSFPKISPDGKWVVFVKARNGQLMRPDGRLFIVPIGGGAAREMTCNTKLMNSWHSFSPNGRWMVFSSKSRTPYTQMFLTHINEDGSDSPAILIDNSTAANRAVNIPEFVNIPPDGMAKIEAPVTEFYRAADIAAELEKKGEFLASAAEWRRALELEPNDAVAHLNLGVALSEGGRDAEAIPEWERALELSPDYPEAHNDLANALARGGKLDEAVGHYEKALALNPEYVEAHHNLGNALAMEGKLDEAIVHFRRTLALKPGLVEARGALAMALAMSGKFAEAIPEAQRAIQTSGGKEPALYDLLATIYIESGHRAEAIQTLQRALPLATGHPDLANALRQKLAELQKPR